MASRVASGRSVRVALVGMMGSGKSAVGRSLARELGLEFVDTDAVIEAETGHAIAEIFATRGEAAFRELERRLISRLADWRRAVLALGGGMFVGEANVEALRSACYCVWLRARPETLIHRLGSRPGDVRPLIAGSDVAQRLETLLEAREPWYRRAHVIVDVDEVGIDDLVERITQSMGRAGRCA